LRDVWNGVTRMDLVALENTSKIVLNQFEPIYFNVYKHKRLKVVNFGMSNANGNGNGTERFQIEIS